MFSLFVLSLTSSLSPSLLLFFFFTQNSIFLARKLFTPISRACLFFCLFSGWRFERTPFSRLSFLFLNPLKYDLRNKT